MKKTLLFLAITLLFSSCATILNQPVSRSTIITTEPSTIIYKEDTLYTVNNKTKITYERSERPLVFIAQTDSTHQAITVDSKNSYWYNANFIHNLGIGMLIDRNNPKRFAYPKFIHINSTDTLNQFLSNPLTRTKDKGELYLHLSLPHINSFRLTPDNEALKVNTGFWGGAIGLDYYHHKNQFVSLSVGSVLDLWFPLPAAVDNNGEYEVMSSNFLNLANNHKIKRLSLGYGISYAVNTWEFKYGNMFDDTPPTRDPIKRSHSSLGFIFPAYYQLTKGFHLGLLYRPTFYRPNSQKVFEYEHLISIDIAWKIRLH